MKPALTKDEWKVGRVWFRDRRSVVERQDPAAPVTKSCVYDSYGIELEHGTPNTRDAPMLAAFDGSWSAFIHDNTRHAAAALCLHGQDFGFNRSDVALERSQVSEEPMILEGGYQTTLVHVPVDLYPGCMYELVVPKRLWKAWCERADRIEALLPPEDL